jgi:hypothetical protein
MTIAPALHVLLAMPVLAGAAEGHFAAWEPPKYLSEEIRAGFRSLRT